MCFKELISLNRISSYNYYNVSTINPSIVSVLMRSGMSINFTSFYYKISCDIACDGCIDYGNNKCIACAPAICQMFGCKTCVNSPSYCTSCIEGYTFDNNRKSYRPACPVGTYRTPGACTPCTSSYFSCYNATYCL